MKSFADLGLSEMLLRAVAGEGYHAPTPIQAKVIPRLLAGGDVLGIAQTGTGKTAAFLLPLLHRIGTGAKPRTPRSGQALILVPTRELAAQIADEIGRYSTHMRVAHAVVVGGVKAGPQTRALARGVDIVVATPGRLLDHLASGTLELGPTTMVVLDEADRMLDLGFAPAIRRIMAALPKQRQTVLMSATMPTEIRSLAAKFQTNPAEVAVAPVARPIAEIAQRVIEVESAAKRGLLADILGAADVSRAIVFARTKHGADKVNRHLQGAGLSATAIHGNKSQAQRQRALDSFRAGQTPILVATDIAARGIHVDDVSHVINYELPEVAEVYVHRIGRTARAGRSGVAISLCSPQERKLLRSIERLTGIELNRGDAPDAPGAPSAPTPASESEATGARGGPNRAATGKRAAGRRRKREEPTGPRPNTAPGARHDRKPPRVAKNVS